jgi:exopolysaccharide biosynthesis protein
MEINNVKAESKSWFLSILNQYKKPLFLILLGIVSVVLLVYAFNSYGKDYVTEIINNLVKSQMETIDQNYNNQLKIRDDQLQNLQRRLSASEKISADIKKRVNDVEIKIKERKAPVTSSELRDRSSALGFKPVN